MRRLGIAVAGTCLMVMFPLHGQLKVRPDGFVGIGTNDPRARLHVYGEGLLESHAGNWQPSLTTTIHYRDAGAYHLHNRYYGRDVFFVNGRGWSWTARGSYTGTDTASMEVSGPVADPLARVLHLSGVQFRFRETERSGKPGPERFGLVAQQVARVAPEAVRTMRDSTMSVSYSDVVTLLVEAMKEQQLQIDSLRTALSDQQTTIDSIKKKRWFRKRLR